MAVLKVPHRPLPPETADTLTPPPALPRKKLRRQLGHQRMQQRGLKVLGVFKAGEPGGGAHPGIAAPGGARRYRHEGAPGPTPSAALGPD